MMVMDSCCARKPNKKQKRDKYGEVLNIISYCVFFFAQRWNKNYFIKFNKLI